MNGAFTSWSLNSKVNFWLCFRIHFLRTFETVIHAECCHCIVSHRLLQCYQPRVLVFSRYILLSYFLTYIAVSFKLFLITFYFHSWVKTWPKIQLLSIFELVYILLYQNVWDNLGRRFRGTKSGDSGGGLQYRKGLETLFYFTASSCFSKYHSFKSHCWSQTILKLPTDFVYPPPPLGAVFVDNLSVLSRSFYGPAVDNRNICFRRRLRYLPYGRLGGPQTSSRRGWRIKIRCLYGESICVPIESFYWFRPMHLLHISEEIRISFRFKFNLLRQCYWKKLIVAVTNPKT